MLLLSVKRDFYGHLSHVVEAHNLKKKNVWSVKKMTDFVVVVGAQRNEEKINLLLIFLDGTVIGLTKKE